MFPKPSFPISLHLRYEMKKLRSQDCALFMSNYLKMSSVTLWFSKRQTSAPKMSLSTVQMTGPDFAFSTLVLLSKRWVENRLRIKYLTCVKLAKKKKKKRKSIYKHSWHKAVLYDIFSDLFCDRRSQSRRSFYDQRITDQTVSVFKVVVCNLNVIKPCSSTKD